MTSSHFSFPWLWSNCADSTQCEKVAHVPFDAETAKKYPREWLEATADGWVISKNVVITREEDLVHRTEGPAVEWDDGRKEWWMNGTRHRVDGPAVEWDEANREEWWMNGERHRLDGPAVISDDREEWWMNDKLHRTDGPAREWADGTKQWWFNGAQQQAPEMTK